MYKIGEFSNLSGLSINTLHHYNDMGVLKPEKIDEFTGYRYYSPRQLVTVNKILALKDAGFSLSEIANLLSSFPSADSIITMLENKAEMLEDVIMQESDRLNRLRNNIFLIKNGGVPIMNEITIKRVEPILIASTRRKIEKFNFEKLGEMWKEVTDYIDKVDTKLAIPCMTLYHGGTWDCDAVDIWDIETAEAITKLVPGSDTVMMYELPAVDKMACVVHHGPFETIGDTYGAISQWIKENHYTIKGQVREIYHKGEWMTDDPKEYVTELQFPLA